MSTTSYQLPTATEPKKRTAIVNVRVFKFTTVGQPTTVVIEGDQIVEASNAVGAEEVDGDGGVLIPGLIDCSCNVDSEAKMKMLTTYGITTVLDMGESPLNIVREMRALAGKPGYPDFKSAGLVATLLDASAQSPDPPGVMLGVSTARQWVEERRSDFIRLVSDHPIGLQPDVKVLAAAAAEARELGMLSIANGMTRKGQQNAQDARVDFIMNSPLDEALDERFVMRMAAETRAAIPTLIMMKLAVEDKRASDQTSSRRREKEWGYMARQSTSKQIPSGTFWGLDYCMAGEKVYHAKFDLPPHQISSRTEAEWDYSMAAQSVNLMYRAKVAILAGTDHSTNNFALARPEIGSAMHEELELLVDAGLTPADAIRAATLTPGRLFFRDRGGIIPGLRADLVLLEDDPLTDIRNIRKIKRVWTNGVSWTPPPPP